MYVRKLLLLFVVADNQTAVKNALTLKALLRAKRPRLQSEERADPDHISYREYLTRNLRTQKRLKRSGAQHHSVKLNSPFDFVYKTDTESEKEESDEEEYYCINCRIRLTTSRDLCLSCLLHIA